MTDRQPDEKNREVEPAAQILPRLQPPFHLEEEVGEDMERGRVLQREMPEEPWKVRTVGNGTVELIPEKTLDDAGEGERKTGLEPATYSLGSCRSTR